MSDGRIEKYDIVSQEAIETVNQCIARVNELSEQMKSLVIAINSAQGAGDKNKTTIDALNKAVDDYNKIEQASKDRLNDVSNATNTLIEAQVKAAKAKKDLTDAIKADVKEQEIENRVKEGSLGTLEKLTIRNKQLKEERQKLNLETKEGVIRLEEINTELDKNDKLTLQSVSSDEKRTKGIGQYKEAIQGVIAKLAIFAVAFEAGKKIIDFFATSSEAVSDRIKISIAGFQGAIGVLKGEFAEALLSIDDKTTKVTESTTHWYTTALAGAKAYYTALFQLLITHHIHFKEIIDDYKKEKEKMDIASNAAIIYNNALIALEKADTKLIEPRAIANAQIKEARELLLDENLTIQEKIKQVNIVNDLEEKTTQKEIKNQNDRIAIIKTYHDSLVKIKQDTRELDRQDAEARAKIDELEGTSALRKLRLKREVYNLEKQENKKFYDDEVTALKENDNKINEELLNQTSNGIITKNQYEIKSLELSIQEYEKELILAKKYHQETRNLEDQLNKAKIELAKKNQKIAYDELLITLKEHDKKENQELANQYSKGKITKQEYEAEKLRLTIISLQTQIDIAKGTGQEILTFEDQLSKARIALSQLTGDQIVADEKKSQHDILEMQKKTAEEFKKYAGQMGDALGQALTQGKEGRKAALKEMIDDGLDALKAYVRIQEVIITAGSLATPDSILSFGASGLTRAGLINGLIEAGFAMAKTVINYEIDQLATGTPDWKGGVAMVGEGKGREGIVLPTGEHLITPDYATLAYLPQHTIVEPDLNKFFLESMIDLPKVKDSQGMNTQLIKEIGKNMKTKTNVNVIIDGTPAYRATENAYITYINHKFRGKIKTNV